MGAATSTEKNESFGRVEPPHERRVSSRDSLEGVVEMSDGAGLRTACLAVDLSEGGWSIVSDRAPVLDQLVCLEVAGLVVEARVRYVSREGVLYRVGLEAV